MSATGTSDEQQEYMCLLLAHANVVAIVHVRVHTQSTNSSKDDLRGRVTVKGGPRQMYREVCIPMILHTLMITVESSVQAQERT